MSILTYGIWLALFLGAFVAAITFLPDGTAYPVPQEVFDAIDTVHSYFISMDAILPVSTMLTILYWAILLKVTVYLVFPAFRWIVGIMTKTNP